MKQKKKFIMPHPSRVAFNIFNYLGFGILTLLCVYPLWYIFIYSISDPDLTATQKVILYPLGFSLINLKEVLGIGGIANAIFISVSRTLLGTFCTVFVCTLLGFIYSKQHFPGRKFLYRMLIVTMYVSGGMIPTYLTYKAYGLLNNFAVYIIPTLISAYYVILVKTYIEQIPASLEESARLDGAGHMQVFLHIIFPMSKPIVATISVYAAVRQWNAWFDNHVYAFSNKKIQTLQYMLYKYLQEAERLIEQMQQSGGEMNVESMLTPFSIRMAVTLITVVPILLVYPFLQRYIVKGIMIGAVKG